MRPEYIQNREDTARKKREREQHEDNIQIVRALNRVADELVATEKQESAAEEKKASRERLTIILIFLTLIATGFLAGYTRALWVETHDSVVDARKTSEAQTESTQRLWP